MKITGIYCLISIFTASFLVSCSGSRRLQTNNEEPLLEKWMRSATPVFDSVLAHQQDWRIQILYTTIHRNKNGRIELEDHGYGVDTALYFYPASTVKLPVALLALQKLHQLSIPGVDRETMMITEAAADFQSLTYNDPLSAKGSPSVAQYIKKVFLVSDNDAFNRLYEWLGPDYINTQLRQRGFNSVSISHRLSVSLTAEQNRSVNPVRFLDSSARSLLEVPARKDQWAPVYEPVKIGDGYYQAGKLVQQPFDFTYKNRFSLPDLHRLLKAIFFPEAIPASQRFDVAADDLDFLKQYMAAYPYQGLVPAYQKEDQPDSIAKVYAAAAGPVLHAPWFRVYDKVGGAYGFLTNTAYVHDEQSGIEFLLSATIYCNSDGIINDDKYDYQQTGYPFLRALARMIYEKEKAAKQGNDR